MRSRLAGAFMSLQALAVRLKQLRVELEEIGRLNLGMNDRSVLATRLRCAERDLQELAELMRSVLDAEASE